MTKTTKSNVTWWTPTGWLRDAPPQGYSRFLIGAEDDWDSALQNVGYEKLTSVESCLSASVDVQLVCYQHEDDHLFVVIGDSLAFIGRCFVQADHVDAFFFDKWPELLARTPVMRQAAALEHITKTIAAFVRHGQGISTISQWGDRNLEDFENDRRSLEARKRARQQAAEEKASVDKQT